MEQVRLNGLNENKLAFNLLGDIDAGNAEEFYNIVVSAYENSPANLHFDCAELAFIDSTTLGTFVKILKKVKTNGHTMSLVNLPAKIKKLFLICSLDSIMEIA
ncbi:MAG: STAS domain-containing protein [Clostridia bacterium]|nr:STAS domain-containing protein [Clostridia bacterium]